MSETVLNSVRENIKRKAVKEISATFSSEHTAHFLIDSAADLGWVGSFPDEDFDRFFVVIDENVNEIWGDVILGQLKRHNKMIFLFAVKAVEQSKSISFYPEVIRFLQNHRCNRFDLVIAVGGGITIDLVSFVVSTYMRGLPLYIIPTTLIGQVDAATAGKTCLNTESCKNLLGTFYYPLMVYNNVCFLGTVSNRYLRQGFSEVFKYGLLGSELLIERLMEYHRTREEKILLHIIALTIEIRIAVRKRHALASNLGHTFGHAIEKLSDYEILHGDAISIGTIIALNLFQKIDVHAAEKNLVNRVVEKMKKLGLNIYLDKDMDAGKLVETMMYDKKSSSSNLNLVLIEDIAQPYVVDGDVFYRIKPDTVKSFLEDFIDNYEYGIPDCAGFLKRDSLDYEGG